MIKSNDTMMIGTQNLLDTLTKAVSFKYKEDKTAPGITISSLKNGYYCSVVRYSGAFAKGKEVVCHVQADTLNKALQDIGKLFLNKATTSIKDPLQELASLLA